MKTLHLIFVLCLTVFSLSAQDYLITFSGTGESDTVSSVIVKNLTRNGSKTLNGNDTLHLKSKITEISDLAYNQTEGIQFYPNPMKEFSVMEFAIADEDVAKIELFDLTGRKLTQTRNYLNSGRHSYRIAGVGSGIYVLKVTVGNFFLTGKLISDNKTGDMAKITYQNTIPFKTLPTKTKSAESEIFMQYNTGDALKFTATSGEHKAVKVEVISQSKNIEITFYKCTDLDNRNYATVKINDQVWMAENLAYLPAVSLSSALSYTKPYYYVYGYEGTNVAAAKATPNYTTYGALYNWPAAIAACPPGWHLPSDAEWSALTSYLGTESIAGSKMKEPVTKSWLSPNPGATNESGFSALLGGRKYLNFLFGEVTDYGYWWSSTESFTTGAWFRGLYFSNSTVHRDIGVKGHGYSVRYVRD